MSTQGRELGKQLTFGAYLKPSIIRTQRGRGKVSFGLKKKVYIWRRMRRKIRQYCLWESVFLPAVDRILGCETAKIMFFLLKPFPLRSLRMSKPQAPAPSIHRRWEGGLHETGWKSIMLSLWSEKPADRAQNVSSLARQRQPWPGTTDIDYNDLKAISSWICLPFILPSFSKSVHSVPQKTISPWSAGFAIGRTLRVTLSWHQLLITKGLVGVSRNFRILGHSWLPAG